MPPEDVQEPRTTITPRVSITYDLAIGDRVEKRSLPFVVGVLADLSGHPPEPVPHLRQRRFVEINMHNFDNVLGAICPRLALTVPNRSGSDPAPNLHLELNFRSMADFAPHRVALQIEPLRQLLELRHRLAKLHGLRGDTVNEGEIERALTSELLTGAGSLPEDQRAKIDAQIAEIDAVLSAQLNEILHHREFQRLEAAWRGLHYLVFETPPSDEIRVKVLNVSKPQLFRDCTRAVAFDQTALFKKVYEEEYGTLGGCPFDVLIGDFEFGLEAEDLDILETVSFVAAAAQAPFLASAAPGMFGMRAFTELAGQADLTRAFEVASSARWNSLRESDEARFVMLILPRMLMRLPFGKEVQPAESFGYEERVDGTDHDKYLWGNAAYALGARLTNAFARHGWCAAIHGVESGGLVENLPVHTFFTANGDIAAKCPTEIALTDRRSRELESLGFTPLLYYVGTDAGVFLRAVSCHKPRLYPSPEENTDARLRAELTYALAAARFAHYMRCIVRDKIGSFPTREELEQSLNAWISGYTLLDDRGNEDRRAIFPLKEARVEVAGGEWRHSATLHILPHFQLSELSRPLKIVFSLPF